jgi:hypothetical protein
MARALLVSLVLLLCVPPRAARAAERPTWSRTFTAAGLATQLGEGSGRYIVVAAGERAPELARAEQALTAALRTGGRATLVMSAQALGAVAQLSDAEIVQRSATFPVDRVVVLRLFPDATGALTQAVVALYDTAGASQGTFVAAAGTPLDAGATAAAAPSAVAPAPQADAAAPPAAQPPADGAAPPADSPQVPSPLAPRRPPLSLAEAKEQYELKRIAFDDHVAISVYAWGYYPTASVSRWSVPYEGKFKKSLEGKAFYERLGRKDLVAAYEKRIATKATLGVLGGAAVVGGGLLMYQGLTAKHEDCDVFSSSWDACTAANDRRFSSGLKKAGVGLGVMAVVGGGLLGGALLMNPHPVNGSQARELADAYNKQLRVDLGLEEDGDAPKRPSVPPVLQVQLGAEVGPDGAGLQLAGRF